MKKKLNLELLAKELDARAFAELLDNNNIDFGWVDVDNVSNPNDGVYHIELQGKAYLFIDGKLQWIEDEA
jgi:hypothetical protein